MKKWGKKFFSSGHHPSPFGKESHLMHWKNLMRSNILLSHIFRAGLQHSCNYLCIWTVNQRHQVPIQDFPHAISNCKLIHFKNKKMVIENIKKIPLLWDNHCSYISISLQNFSYASVVCICMDAYNSLTKIEIVVYGVFLSWYFYLWIYCKDFLMAHRNLFLTAA